jgi:hypothetical protein
MKPLTFKQYLESKEKLREAIANTPVSIVEYEIKDYCSIHLGEDKQDSTSVSLKPKYVITVEWLYEDLHNPTAQSITISGATVDDSESFTTFWSSQKLQRWLARHSKQRA